jgi:hypothetical protein
MSNTPTPDYYKILQVDPLAEEEVIVAAYRGLARKYHPDVYSGPDAAERMRELNLAYSIVGNAAKRRLYDLARQREAERQEAFELPYQSPLTRTSGRQRAVTAEDMRQRTTGRQRAITHEDLTRRTTGKQRAITREDLTSHHQAEVTSEERRRAREEAQHRMYSTAPSVRVSTGNWPAITPNTGKIPVVSGYVYRPSLFKRLFEELMNLGQGILAIGLLYPIAVAVCWFSLQAFWQHLGLSPHQIFLLTLALPLLPTLIFAWWFGRRIRQGRL